MLRRMSTSSTVIELMHMLDSDGEMTYFLPSQSGFIPLHLAFTKGFL